MSEVWRDITGFNGRYQVSTLGNVRSFAHSKVGRVLKAQKFSNGYLFVQLGRDGGSHLVHRLVASAFISGDMSLQVNHINGVRADNSVINLEWLSCSDNHKHSHRELDRKQHKLTQAVVLNKGDTSLVFPSILAAAIFFGKAAGSVASAFNKHHKFNGYEVNYVF